MDTVTKTDKALQHVYDLCDGKVEWTMRIPVNEEKDSDCIIVEALIAAKKDYTTLAAENESLKARVRELEEVVLAMEEGIIAVYDLINASHGVYGLHLNGDPSPWVELQTGGQYPWLNDFDNAIEAIRKYKASDRR